MRKALRNKLGKEEESDSENSKSDDDVEKVTMQDVKTQLTEVKESENKMKELEEKPNFTLTKETAYRIWHAALKDVPDDYDFIIQSHADSFKKGSQVFLCYGRMSNRDALKRYGFCLTSNKYNNMYIKLRL